MTHIVQDLLTLSRFDSERDELKLARFPFGEAVKDIYNAVYIGRPETQPNTPHPGRGSPTCPRSWPTGSGCSR